MTSMLVGDEEEDGVATVPYSPVGNTDGVNGIVELENLFSTYQVFQVCDMLTITCTTAVVKCSLSLPSTSCRCVWEGRKEGLVRRSLSPLLWSDMHSHQNTTWQLNNGTA